MFNLPQKIFTPLKSVKIWEVLIVFSRKFKKFECVTQSLHWMFREQAANICHLITKITFDLLSRKYLKIYCRKWYPRNWPLSYINSVLMNYNCFVFLLQRLKPSNHATIQSMVHAIGIYTNVPAPCCVPDSLSSITLLYFDENRNVVLKNYPSMTVNSCACR